MKRQFVMSENYKRFRATVIAAEQRGAEEAGWLLVVGPPGVGKTTMLRHYAIETGAVWLSAKPNWNIRYFMDELAEALDISPQKSKARERDALIVGKIAREQIPIIIDEVENCLRHGHGVLEQVRAISDATETMVILSGMEDERKQNIQSALARAMQFSSRMFKVMTANAASAEDVKRFAAELCECQVADELAQKIWEDSKGILRPVKNALSKVERTAKRLKLDTVGLADLEGQELCPQWRDAPASAPSTAKP